MGRPRSKIPKTEIALRYQEFRGQRRSEDFAVKLGISLSAEYHYESGERNPPFEVLSKMAELGMSVNYLLTGKGPMQIIEGEAKGPSPDMMDSAVESLNDLYKRIKKGKDNLEDILSLISATLDKFDIGEEVVVSIDKNKSGCS